jgi:hypothetical protein
VVRKVNHLDLGNIGKIGKNNSYYSIDLDNLKVKDLEFNDYKKKVLNNKIDQGINKMGIQNDLYKSSEKNNDSNMSAVINSKGGCLIYFLFLSLWYLVWFISGFLIFGGY